MISKQKKAIFFALLAAVLYAINSPFSKLLLDKIPATMMAAFLYLGAGVGLAIMGIVQRAVGRREKELPLTKKELPYTIGAAKTSAYYAAAPFVGAGLSLLIFRELPSISYIVALVIMLAGTYFASSDTPKAD